MALRHKALRDPAPQGLQAVRNRHLQALRRGFTTGGEINAETHGMETMRKILRWVIHKCIMCIMYIYIYMITCAFLHTYHGEKKNRSLGYTWNDLATLKFHHLNTLTVSHAKKE